MLPVATLISEFEIMYKEHWQYIWGYHEQGIVDCSGAFYYAFKKHNLPMYNGSNRIARVYTTGGLVTLERAKKEGLLTNGMAAFKHYAPTNKNYKLGDGYKPKGAYYNGDLNDYYHIGLYVNGCVLNAQGEKTGFVKSKLSENWTYVAFLKNIDYGGVSPMLETTKTVIRTSDTSAGSKTVNVRSKPSTSSPMMFTVPFGSVVTVYSTDNEWSQIAYGGRNGWMMSKFLASQEQLAVPVEVRESLNKINGEMDNIFNIIGRG